MRKGWIIDRLAEDLIALGWDRTLNQVKQKFGALRFYISQSSAAPLSPSAIAAMAGSTSTAPMMARSSS